MRTPIKKRYIAPILILLLGIAWAGAQLGEIEGKVLDASSGKGIAKASCSAAGLPAVKTDVQGHFLLLKIPAGVQKLRCKARGYRSGRLKVKVEAGKRAQIELKLKPKGKKQRRSSKSKMKQKAVGALGSGSGVVHDLGGLGTRGGLGVGGAGLGIGGAGKGGGGSGYRSLGSARSSRRGYAQGFGGGRIRSGRAQIAGRAAPRYMIAREVAAGDYNREEYGKLKDNDFEEATKKPLSTLSIDVDTAAYSNVRRFINESKLPPKDAVKIEEFLNYFSYDYPNAKGKHPFSITTEVSIAPWNPKHRLVHLGLQAQKIDRLALPPNNLVFLLDVSGSMNSPDKLPLLKSAFRLLLKNLRPEDRVAIVVYAGSSGLALPSTPIKQSDKIFAILDQLRAGGSTAGGAGIQLAYKVAQDNFIKGGNNRVILATDGDFNVGASSEGALVRLIEKKRKSDIFLTVLGFGRGNYQAKKMESLADKGNGNFAYIDSVLEAQKVLVKEMGGTLLTVAKDVKFQIEFNPSRVKAWRLLGYENRILAAKDFNDDKKDAGELGAGHTVTVLYELIPAGSPEQIPGVDKLKYQKRVKTAAAEGSGELMTVKLRYKPPTAKKSILMTQALMEQDLPLERTTNAFRFSSAVAELALLLRDSKYKGSANFGALIKRARESMGKDPNGYRFEFTKLAEKAKLLKSLKK